MKDLKEKEAPLIFRRLTLEINTSLPYFSRRSRTDLIPKAQFENLGELVKIPIFVG